MRIHGLEPRQGETSYAFLVLRFARAIPREGLGEIARHMAPISPHIEGYLDELPADAVSFRIIGLPWQPPEAGRDVDVQRRLVEASASKGVEEAWFFQTGTSLPPVAEADDESRTQPIQIYPASDDADDDAEGNDGQVADDATWSHGPPPQAGTLRFPVDGFPAILEEHDGEDFGIAFKLAGSPLAGEDTVLIGFHAMWMTPYGGRQRNTAVTIDRKRHAAHLWVDRFAVPVPVEEQVGFLLWIVSKLDEVVPVVHARFAEATTAQKYAELIDPAAEPFVLGGNPLVELHAGGGDDAVDAWLAEQTVWSNEEVAQMLRLLAIELVTSDRETAADEEDADDDEDTGSTRRAPAGAPLDDEDDDSGRYIATYAASVLAARARAGKLDARVADRLRPILAKAEKHEHRRTSVIELLGAIGDRASVAAIMRVIETSPIDSMLDAIAREPLLTAAAEALGALGDPAAIHTLATLVAQDERDTDRPRPAAARALGVLLAVAPEPRDIDDAAVTAMLQTIAERDDGEINTELHLAYGAIARALPAPRREALRARLAAAPSGRSDDDFKLARATSLVLAGAPRTPALDADIRAGLHAWFSAPGDSDEATQRNLGFAFRIVAERPDLIDLVAGADLGWLTTHPAADIRTKAHALLTRLGSSAAPAHVVDRNTVVALTDAELVAMISERAVVGRVHLVVEAARRKLAAATAPIIAATNALLDDFPSADMPRYATTTIDAAVTALRSTVSLSDDAVALADRLLRHPSSTENGWHDAALASLAARDSTDSETN